MADALDVTIDTEAARGLPFCKQVITPPFCQQVIATLSANRLLPPILQTGYCHS
jgi:hypothetical protein